MWTYHDRLSPSTEYYKGHGESLSAILDEVQSSSCDSTSFFSAFDLNVSNVSAEAGCVSQCRLESLDNLPIRSRCCHVKAMKLELKGFEFGNHVGCWTLDSLWDFLSRRTGSDSWVHQFTCPWWATGTRSANVCRLLLYGATWRTYVYRKLRCFSDSALHDLTMLDQPLNVIFVWPPNLVMFHEMQHARAFGNLRRHATFLRYNADGLGSFLYWARGQRWRVCQFGMFVFGSRIFYPTAKQLLAT